MGTWPGCQQQSIPPDLYDDWKAPGDARTHGLLLMHVGCYLLPFDLPFCIVGGCVMVVAGRDAGARHIFYSSDVAAHVSIKKRNNSNNQPPLLIDKCTEELVSMLVILV